MKIYYYEMILLGNFVYIVVKTLINLVWKPEDYCSDNLVYKRLFEWIANIEEEEFTSGVFHNRRENFVYQGRNETLSCQAFEGVKFMAIVNASDIFGRFFWRQIFYSREFHTTNATVGDLSNTRVLLLVNKIYALENKHLFGIYTVVNQVTLRRKEICSLRRWLYQYLLQGFEWVKPCKFVVVVSIGQKVKTKIAKESQRVSRETDFSRVRWLGEEWRWGFPPKSKVVFCEQKEDMIHDRMAERWPNSSEMVQLFLVERSWNQWFLSKKIFCIH